ncbi:unnamed protein product [Ambrosiozyma monospora]|uniref:Unnamed protein product n=1 Tax=Ambrosiozyma monospora TaxID=43982 RepID=A0A9W7DIV5_AMBMO|nr:unnamed protein product [Ambrosiozyma monospora]
MTDVESARLQLTPHFRTSDTPVSGVYPNDSRSRSRLRSNNNFHEFQRIMVQLPIDLTLHILTMIIASRYRFEKWFKLMGTSPLIDASLSLLIHRTKCRISLHEDSFSIKLHEEDTDKYNVHYHYLTSFHKLVKLMERHRLVVEKIELYDCGNCQNDQLIDELLCQPELYKSISIFNATEKTLTVKPPSSFNKVKELHLYAVTPVTNSIEWYGSHFRSVVHVVIVIPRRYDLKILDLFPLLSDCLESVSFEFRDVKDFIQFNDYVDSLTALDHCVELLNQRNVSVDICPFHMELM